MSITGRATLAGVPLGEGLPVAVMGVLNVSPESFYGGSVRVDADALRATALGMVEAGAALVDVGARSTAPYGEREIDDAEEAERLGRAIERLAKDVPVPISADTTRPGPARAAVEAGARVLNDVSGLADREVAALAAERDLGLILMAAPVAGAPPGDPIDEITGRLTEVLARVRARRIAEDRVVLDPGIGFFREGAVPWPEWDVEVLAHLEAYRGLGRPLCVGVSRKSFLGALTGRSTPAERLAASLAAAALAVLHGAALIRTHDVAETVDAVRVAERIRDARR